MGRKWPTKRQENNRYVTQNPPPKEENSVFPWHYVDHEILVTERNVHLLKIMCAHKQNKRRGIKITKQPSL